MSLSAKKHKPHKHRYQIESIAWPNYFFKQSALHTSKIWTLSAQKAISNPLAQDPTVASWCMLWFFLVTFQIQLETLFGVSKPLPEKLSDYLCSCNYPSVNVFNIIKVLCSIRLGLDMVSKYEYNNQLLKNVISIVRNFNGNESLNVSIIITNSVFWVCYFGDYLFIRFF